jgi:putative zinc finger protein
MTCDDVRGRITAYLDGELEGERASAIRGHLRGCAACRTVATDEAALRDGLRALPPLDPPASLWAGVQRQLAAAEVADSRKPSWRRALARFRQILPPLTPRFGLAAVAIAGSVAILAWKIHHAGAPQPTVAHDDHHVVTPPTPPTPTPPPPAPAPALDEQDVTAELAGLAARTTASYAETADELVKVALEQRVSWSDDRKQVFDAKLVDLRHSIDTAQQGRPRQKAYRALIHYLQRVTIRDEVAFADTRGAP